MKYFVKLLSGFVDSLNSKVMVNCHVSDKLTCFNNYSKADELIGLDCFDVQWFDWSPYDDTVKPNQF